MILLFGCDGFVKTGTLVVVDRAKQDGKPGRNSSALKLTDRKNHKRILIFMHLTIKNFEFVSVGQKLEAFSVILQFFKRQ